MVEIKPSVDTTSTLADMKPGISHDESSPPQKSSRWKVSRSGGGDTAMALFNDPEEVDEELDPKEVRALVCQPWPQVELWLICRLG
jgi:hypothetical protein